MERKKMRNLKGFTLVELIVVIAIFGMILAVALGLLDPIGRIFTNSTIARDKETISENLRRYVEDQVQYADRIEVYTNMSLTDAHVGIQIDEFRKKYGFVPEDKSVNLGAGLGTKTVTHTRRLPSSKFEDDIYVLKIDNPDDLDSLDGAVVSVSDAIGTVSLERYHLGSYVTGSRRVWSVDAGYYNDYAFIFRMQTLSDSGAFMPLSNVPKTDENVMAKNFAIGMNMYKKNRIKGDVITNRRAESVFLNRTISFRLKNILDSSGSITTDLIEYIPYDVPGTSDKIELDPREELRFSWFDPVQPNAKSLSYELSDDEKKDNDIMFIFTKSPRIENYTG